MSNEGAVVSLLSDGGLSSEMRWGVLAALCRQRGFMVRGPTSELVKPKQRLRFTYVPGGDDDVVSNKLRRQTGQVSDDAVNLDPNDGGKGAEILKKTDVVSQDRSKRVQLPKQFYRSIASIEVLEVAFVSPDGLRVLRPWLKMQQSLCEVFVACLVSIVAEYRSKF